jgi:hypothetical protein
VLHEHASLECATYTNSRPSSPPPKVRLTPSGDDSVATVTSDANPSDVHRVPSHALPGSSWYATPPAVARAQEAHPDSAATSQGGDEMKYGSGYESLTVNLGGDTRSGGTIV